MVCIKLHGIQHSRFGNYSSTGYKFLPLLILICSAGVNSKRNYIVYIDVMHLMYNNIFPSGAYWFNKMQLIIFATCIKGHTCCTGDQLYRVKLKLTNVFINHICVGHAGTVCTGLTGLNIVPIKYSSDIHSPKHNYDVINIADTAV